MLREMRESDWKAVWGLIQEFHEESNFADLTLDRDYVINLFSESVEPSVAREACWFKGWVLEDMDPTTGQSDIYGGMIAMCTPHFFSKDLQANDLGVFVRKDRRGGTAGARLIRAYMDWARFSGAKIVNLGVSAGIETEKVVALYKRLGFRETGTLMRLEN